MRVFVYEKNDGGRIHIDLDHVLAIDISRRVVRRDVAVPLMGLINIYKETAALMMAFKNEPLELVFTYAEDCEGKKLGLDGNEALRANRFQDLLKAWRGDS